MSWENKDNSPMLKYPEKFQFYLNITFTLIIIAVSEAGFFDMLTFLSVFGK